MRFKKENAYMTIEASIIMPFVIFLMALLIYLTFFVYDRCLIDQDAYRMAFDASIADDPSNFATRNWNTLLTNKYVSISHIQHSARTSASEVSVQMKTSYIFPFSQIFRFKNGIEISAQRSAQVMDPVEIIRKDRILINLAKEVFDK